MRKNFLLLFLLALLPITAFAVTDISTSSKIKMSTGNTAYGANQAPAIQLLDEGYLMIKGTAKDYTWDEKYYTTEACDVVAGDINELAVGTYWVKVQGIGVYTGVKKASFEVEKKVVKPTLSIGLSKTYGDDDPVLVKDNINWTTTNAPSDPDDLTATDGKFKTAADQTEFKNFLNDIIDYHHSGVNASTEAYPISIEVIESDKYILQIEAGIRINRKEITSGEGGMITAVTLSDEYKGENITEFNLNVKDGSTPLVAGTDFVVKAYTDSEFSSSSVNVRNVGTYYLAIEDKEGTNYSVSGKKPAGSFTVTQALLTVVANDQQEDYAAKSVTAFLAEIDEQDKFTYVGIKGSDAIGGTKTITVTKINEQETALGAYTITPNVGTFSNANYIINVQPGIFVISPKTLTITADPKSMTIGGTVPPLTYTIDGAATATELSAMVGEGETQGQVKAVRDPEDTGINIGEHDIVITYNANASVFANYDVKTVKGTLTINGGTIVVTVKPQTIEYGDAETWSDPQVGRDYYVNNIAEDDIEDLKVKLTRAEKDNLKPGTYSLTAEVIAEPQGYSGVNIVNSTLKINRKALVFTANDQILGVGQTKDAIDYSKIVFEEGKAPVSGDVEDVLELAFAGSVDVDANGKLTTATTYNDGIVISKKDEVDDLYTISTAACKLIVQNALLLSRTNRTDFADPNKNTAANLIAERDGSTIAVSIKYNDDDAFNTFKADQWYAMVLPFDADAKTISNAFGYAIIDVLRTSNTNPNRTYFDLHMNDTKIPANTPFIIKAWKDIDMKTTGVWFSDPVEIVAPADEAELTIEDGAHNKFIGSYTGIIGFGGAGSKDYWYSLTDGSLKQPSANAYLRQLSAYIKLAPDADPAAHEFIIEEADGSTTAIKGISIDAQNINANGIYNLNGMKINGVPTQKGVYIQNGKKVVIK